MFASSPRSRSLPLQHPKNRLRADDTTKQSNNAPMNQTVTDPQPLLFFAWLGLGMTSFLSSLLTLLIRPDILIALPTMSPTLIAWTHLFILGWLCSLFFAAGYQLTPVVTLNPLASRWMSRIHFALHFIGMPTMVVSFYTGHYPSLAIGGALVVIGFLLFAINMLLSAGLQSKWNYLSLMWVTGIFWLLIGSGVAMVAVFMRLQLVDSSQFNAVLGIHIHTMIVGFFLMILMAAASKLVPMFMLSPEKPQYGTSIAGIVLNAVLFAAYFGFLSMDHHYRTALCMIALIALVAYFCQLAFFARNKRRKWDAGMVLFYAANLSLIPAWCLFYQFHNKNHPNAEDLQMLRSAVFTVTFLTFNGCILGMSQKIVPFMLWHQLYSKHLGKAKVPQTKELLASWTLWPIAIAYLIATSLFLAAQIANLPQLIRPATIAMLLGFIFVACNAPTFASHWRHPQLIPFNKKP